MQSVKFLLLALLLPLFGVAQKTYTFDRIMLYDFQIDLKSKARQHYILTNSQDGSYSAALFERQDGTFYISFSDVDRTSAGGDISKSDFLKAETITLKSARKRGSEVDRSKEYNLQQLSDTLVENKELARYIFKSDNPKRKHRKQNSTVYCVIADNTDYQAPIHDLFCIFDFLAMNENTPRGIPKILYLNYFGDNTKRCIYKLKEIVEIKKYIYIPKVD